MKLFLTTALLIAAILVVDAKFWQDCSSSDDKSRATIQSITLNPPEPKKGDDLTIEATFTLLENITSATANIEAKLDGIKLYSGKQDLCDALKQINMTCPLSAKQYTIKVSTKIPSIAPRGTYSADAKAYDQNGKEIACLTGTYKLE